MNLRYLCLATILAGGCASAPLRSPPAADADRLSTAGSTAYADGNWNIAVARFTDAADAARSVDDRPRLARELHNRGMALLAAGSAEAAISDLTEAVRLTADPALAAPSRLALARALLATGKRGAALAEADRATADTSDRDLAARAAATAAVLALIEGDLIGAERRLAGLNGETPAAAGALAHARAAVALAAGDTGNAETAAASAVDQLRNAGDLPGLRAALLLWARVAEASGDAAAAAERRKRADGVPAR
jgi:tetratricopeptide (TPR) repeat protein